MRDRKSAIPITIGSFYIASKNDILQRLVKIYANGDCHDKAQIGRVCDEVLDKSGQLLGIVRDKSKTQDGKNNDIG